MSDPSPATAAPHVVRVEELTPAASTTSRFEGVDHGSQSSFYISRDEPGHGPGLHTHPYTETFVVEAGHVRFTVGDRTVDATAGDILVVPPDTPHGFTCLGPGAMRSINIHASAQMVQTDLA